jgi:hypothetical protein
VHSKTWVWFYPVNYSRVCDLREVALWVLTVCTVIQTITAWGYWKGAPSDLGMCTQHCWQLIMNASTDSLIMRGSEAKLLTSIINHTELRRRTWVVVPYVCTMKDTGTSRIQSSI